MAKIIDATKIVLDNLIDVDTGKPIVLERPNGMVFTKEQRTMHTQARKAGKKAGEAFKRMLKIGYYWIEK